MKWRERVTDLFPDNTHSLNQAKPIYKELKPWKESLESFTHWDDLPENAKDYVRFIEKEVSCPVHVVSVGPKRQQTIWIKGLF